MSQWLFLFSKTNDHLKLSPRACMPNCSFSPPAGGFLLTLEMHLSHYLDMLIYLVIKAFALRPEAEWKWQRLSATPPALQSTAGVWHQYLNSLSTPYATLTTTVESTNNTSVMEISNIWKHEPNLANLLAISRFWFCFLFFLHSCDVLMCQKLLVALVFLFHAQFSGLVHTFLTWDS